MATLTGTTPAQTYKDLLQRANNNNGVDATLRVVSGGNGVDTPLYLSTEKVKIKPTTDSTTVFEVHDKDGNVMFTVDTTNNKIIAASGVTWEGNGANLTGITGATGGVSNTASTNIVADSDGTGDGNITLTINATDVVKLKNDGSGTGGILEVVETTTHATPDAGFVGISAENNNLIRVDEDSNADIILTSDMQFHPSWVSFDGVDDYYSVADNDNLSGSILSGSAWIYLTDVTAETIISKQNANYEYLLNVTTGKLRFVTFSGGVSGNSYTFVDTRTLSTNTWYHVAFVHDESSASSCDLYVNGEKATISGTLNGTYTARTNTSIALLIGARSGGTTDLFNGSIGDVKLYNRALSASEVESLYNYGHPELYELPYADRGASQTVLISGTLVVGKRYRINTYVTGDDFTNVGGTNVTGNEFVATGTTPTTWTNGSSLVQIGAVAEFYSENATSYSWIDASGNNLHAQGSGSPIVVRNPLEDKVIRQFKGSIAANTDTALTNIIPKGYRIIGIRAVGSDSLTAIKIGSASAGEQVVASTTTSGTTPKMLTLASTANDTYSESAATTLYARHDTTASGKTMNLIFILEKVNQ